MKYLASLLVLSMASFPTVAQQDPPEKPKVPDYYPLSSGTKWVYRLEVNGADGGTLTNRIAKVEKIDNQSLARLESMKDNNVLATEHLSSTAKGIFRHRLNGAEMDPPLCMLKHPFKNGDTWQTDTMVAGQKIKARCKVTSGEVKVPAGKFKTVIVDIDANDGGINVTTTYWFAPNVGIVRQTANINNMLIVLELEKYEPGK